MKLLFDLGNTRLKWCTLDGDVLGPPRVLPHGADDFASRLGTELGAVGDVSEVWLASVVDPRTRQRVLDLLQPRLAPIRLLGPPRSSERLQLAYRQPSTFGVDRWLCLLAASDAATLVVGCGTALTLDLVDAAGRHHGGLIAASPTLAREALLQRATHLPAAAGTIAEFCENTADAIAAGTQLSATALIERQWQVAAQRLGTSPRLWLTGGGADALGGSLQVEYTLRPQLLFEGMRIALQD